MININTLTGFNFYACTLALLTAVLFCADVNGQKKTSRAANYYVDSKKGDDNFNGRSSKKPWKSLEKVNKTSFAPGDSVLFSRGGVWQGQLVPASSGGAGKSIVFASYGKGEKPLIQANGNTRDAVLIRNQSYIVVRDLALTNKDEKVKEQKTGPTGVRVFSEDFGTISNINLAGLYIHDVNGDNKKGSKEGNGIFWECAGPKQSNIENLVIEDCLLELVDRNGIRGNGTFGIRTNWFPNKNLVIRNCELRDIGGDGIVIKAFDGALVEHNKLFYNRMRAKDNAVGIWPHSSDNTVIQYNEVAFTQNNDWSNDGQSFDIDGNCKNTVIQYNYSHDNDGGFMLVISDAINKDNIVTQNNVIRYNLSVNDGLKRKRLFNFAGVTDSTSVTGNIFYNDTQQEMAIELADIEVGIPKNVVFNDNSFVFAGNTTGVFLKSPKQYKPVMFSGNQLTGNIAGKDNLVNLVDKVETGASRNAQFPQVSSFPWKFLPEKCRTENSGFPQTIYSEMTGK
ncbi:right-handed parallel beta-helix repeat-containing protein [Dyadobacter psychrotolerans]|uniref:Uncharacterized protein n=1 Tax=Dyadobacter psychrotolerans TaxID=2541721 RepID=A0A4R5E0E2_9BACT|nr:right-handed parallel beta-helix repeat-containing protein [Dyadobacter psychrotolerans]TDE17215.1 hypothetical protein E0F88_04765 [Dyadobacter psychrotolerans]